MAPLPLLLLHNRPSAADSNHAKPQPRTFSAAKVWLVLSSTSHTVLKWPQPSFLSTT
jgi:hypothetical protein